MKIPERRESATNGTGSSSSALVPGPLQQYCEIWAFLTGCDVKTGISRASGNLSLKFASGYLGLTLNDTETGQYAFLQGLDLEVLLMQAESGLEDGSLHWRASGYSQKKRK